MKKLISLLLAITLILTLSLAFTSCDDGEGDGAKPEYVEMKFKANDEGFEGGSIIIKLDYESAPETAENFRLLVEGGFYDGLDIFRTVKNTLIQGGCPNSDGTGNSKYTIKGEFANNNYEGNNIEHKRGVISMARESSDPDSASCQFFIVLKDEGGITFDGNYAAFGYVVEGMEVVDAIAEYSLEKCAPESGSNVHRLGKYNIEIESARIVEYSAE